MKTLLSPFDCRLLIFAFCLFFISSISAKNIPHEDFPADVTIGLKKDVSCYGEDDGAVTFAIVGLSSLVKYSYKLKDKDGQVLKEGSEGLLDNLIKDLPNLDTGLTIRFEDLAAGDYTFEWTSRPLGILPKTTKTVNFTIEQPDKFRIADLNIIDIDCINPTGSIEVITTGGIGGIDLGILNLGGILNLSGDGNTIIDIKEGVYDILATDENGCEADTTAEVENLIELPEVNITGNLNLGCHDLLDLQISSSSGVTLTVETPDGNIVGGLVGNTFSVNTPGLYIATALDPLTGCVSSDTVEVIADAELPLLDLGTDRILGCLDKLELEAITNATQIVWQNLEGTVLGNDKVLEVSAPGTYVAVALNSLTGCEKRDSLQVLQGDSSDNATVEFQAGADVNIGCLEVLDLVLINNEGVSINWETIGGSFLEEPVDNILRVTKPGTYIASGVDLVTGCLVSDTIQVRADVEIGSVDIEADTIELDCDGVAVISADTTELGSNVELLWKTIEGDVEIDEKGTSVEVNTPGTYALIATDIITGCIASDTVVVEGNPSINLQGEISHIACGETASGNISIQVSGGKSPYKYQWSNGDTTRNINHLGPGTYSVEVTDANACTETGSWTIKKRNSPDISVSISPAEGEKAKVTVQVSGGIPPYQYLWSTGENTSSVYLGTGQYAVIVTDSAGCVATESFNVTEEDTGDVPTVDPDSCHLSMKLTVLPSDSISGTWNVEITTEGGSEPYSYKWNTGDSTAVVSSLPGGQYTVEVTDANTCSARLSFSLNNVSDSTVWSCSNDIVIDTCNIPVYYNYPTVSSDQSYTIIQVSGLCSGSIFPLGTSEVAFVILFGDGSYELCSFNVTVNPGPLEYQITEPGCYGDDDGKIKIELPDFQQYYLFLNDFKMQSGMEMPGLKAGNYHLRGINESGCVIDQTIQLDEPDSLLFAEAVILDSKSSEENGQIQITVHGGSYPYTYQWTGPDGFMSDQEDLYQIGPGDYSLVVTDANGCKLAEKVFEVKEDVSTDSDPGLGKNGPSLMNATIYPNPSDGRLNLNVQLEKASDLSVLVLDSKGRSVSNHKFDRVVDSVVRIDISGLVPGVYFIQMRTKDAMVTRRLNVQ